MVKFLSTGSEVQTAISGAVEEEGKITWEGLKSVRQLCKSRCKPLRGPARKRVER